MLQQQPRIKIIPRERGFSFSEVSEKYKGPGVAVLPFHRQLKLPRSKKKLDKLIEVLTQEGRTALLLDDPFLLATSERRALTIIRTIEQIWDTVPGLRCITLSQSWQFLHLFEGRAGSEIWSVQQ